MLKGSVGGRKLIAWILIGWICFFSPPAFADGKAQLKDLLTWFVGDELDYIEGKLLVDGSEFSGKVVCELLKDSNVVASTTSQGPYFACDFVPHVDKAKFNITRIKVECKSGQRQTWNWHSPLYPVGSTWAETCYKEEAKAPTLTSWGLISLGIVLAGSLAWVIGRRVAYRPTGA